jgi:hypothetical protein
MANTTNFNWETPDDTDLVKDGAAAMRTLGNSIDTSFVDLKGGTTGQILSKASNTDLDYTWVTTDDANAIQNAIVDAKGDLIAASANDTPARLAVGNNGETLVADSSTSTGLRWQGDYAAGKNKIINGDFGVWQRGTTFNSASSNTYFADRFTCYVGGGTQNITRQTFTPGTAPVAGYEGQYFLRWTSTSAGPIALTQRVENVQTMAGQTVTFSFWAKADSAINISTALYQVFGSGGSSATVNSSGGQAITTSWARYYFTFNVASIASKTIGTNSYLQVDINLPNSTVVFDTWGWQIETGSIATAFQTATGTLQGELAACQRYYYRTLASTALRYVVGYNNSASTSETVMPFPVTMRTAPTALEQSGTAADYGLLYGGIGALCTSVPSFVTAGNSQINFNFTVPAASLTIGAASIFYAVTANGYLGWSAEL